MFKGSIVAIITPFVQGALDEPAFRSLIRYHAAGGTDAILVGGSTGESVNLTIDELQQLIRWTKDEISKSNKPMQLIAGTGTNSTKSSIERSLMARKEGVDGLLLVTPYYNKPTPSGLYAHFKTVAGSVDCPIILYNVPGRTGVNMLPETVAELSRLENIIAVKEASGNLDQVSRIKTLCSITILSGDDSLTLPVLAIGASGVISVTANIDPVRVSSMCRAWFEGNTQRASELHYELFPLSRIMFIETNPAPAKAALQIMGMITGELRLPLTPVSMDSYEKIKSELQKAGLIKEPA
jgi:4-hydroxy-tetrahydrodipicolinate synthase